VIFGLFARAFRYGINTLAFALVDNAALNAAAQAVGAYYSHREWIVNPSASLSTSVPLQ
jgi:hypothetical protein